jgi:hypothetical protein
MSDHTSYFVARGDEERLLAMASVDPRVRRVHLEMAARYSVAAGLEAILSNETLLSQERPIA